MINFPLTASRKEAERIVPPADAVYPPTVRDIYAPIGVGLFRFAYPLDTPMADPCPCCGAFNMTAGDAYYLGTCIVCFDKEQYGDR
jgi:hypothetical protein